MLWSQIYEETKPKFDPEEIRRAKRPQLVEVEDVSQDLAAILEATKSDDQRPGGDAQDQGTDKRQG